MNSYLVWNFASKVYLTNEVCMTKW